MKIEAKSAESFFDSENELDECAVSLEEEMQKLPKAVFIKFNFPPEEIMMRLNKGRLKRLQKIWENNPDGFELVDFVKIML